MAIDFLILAVVACAFIVGFGHGFNFGMDWMFTRVFGHSLTKDAGWSQYFAGFVHVPIVRNHFIVNESIKVFTEMAEGIREHGVNGDTPEVANAKAETLLVAAAMLQASLDATQRPR